MDKKIEDIEMAITGLEGLRRIIAPLLLSVDYEGLGDEDVKELRKHLNMAANALEKQIPKKPYYLDEEHSYFECEDCGNAIYYSSEKEEHNYCLNCGQKLDWD